MVWVIALEKGFVGDARVKKGTRFNYPLRPGQTRLPRWVTPAPDSREPSGEKPHAAAPASGELVREQALLLAESESITEGEENEANGPFGEEDEPLV